MLQLTSPTPAVDWGRVLPLRRFAWGSGSFRENLADRTILVTGAGGSIGAALARALAGAPVQQLILLDHSEQNLYQIEAELAALAGVPPRTAVLGDVGDTALLESLLREERPEIIFHTAAFKHVPLTEANPFATIRNNALATWHLARLAAEHEVPRLLLVSTDKAANPHSIMGASKRLAELAVLRWNAPRSCARALRLGNVLGSHGSVGPLFVRQVAAGTAVTVTDPRASRYFLTIEDAVHLLLSVASLQREEGLFLPEMGEPVRITELAERLHRLAGDSQKQLKIRFTGLRPGEKVNEDLISSSETLKPTALPGVHRIAGRPVPPHAVDVGFDKVRSQVEKRDLAGLLEAVRELVPEYLPSPELLERSSSVVPATTPQ